MSGQTHNFPDVLGYITGDKRLNVNVVQLAAALQPRVARAGRPFEMYVLIQNASDVDLEVTATLRLPDRDMKRQKGRFVTHAGRLRIGLSAAAVGCVILPVSTLPDTAVGAGYKIGMDISVKPKQRRKPARIRSTEGGGDFDPTLLSDDIQEILEDLKKLNWLVDTPTLRNSSIEASLSVMSGKVGKFADLNPSWTDLWTLRDHQDSRLIFQQLAPIIKEKVMPRFTRPRAFPVLQEATKTYLKQGGYKLTELELDMVTRLIFSLLYFAAADPRRMEISQNPEYNISRYLQEGYLDDLDAVVRLPEWFSAFLRMLAKDERLANHPIKAMTHFMYEDLLRDAMMLALDRIEKQTDVEMGTNEERQQYAEFVQEHIEGGKLNFSLLYVPLVAGGISVCDDIRAKNEDTQELVRNLRSMLDDRHSEVNEDNQPTYDITNKLIERLAQKYIHKQW